jgi:ABC-type sugar transport system ATPase subunit
MVLVPAVVEGEQAVSGPLRVPLTPGQRARLTGSAVTLGLRPSALTLSDAGEVPATVDVVEHLGSHGFVYCTAELGGGPATLIIRSDQRLNHATGDAVTVRVTPGPGLHVFDPATGHRVDG